MRQSNRVPRRTGLRSGVALVELGIAITVFLLLAAGTLQYGVVLQATISLSQISGDTARVAALPANNTAAFDAKLQETARGFAVNTAVGSQSVTASIAPAAPRALYTPFTVTVRYPMRNKVFFPYLPGMAQFNSTYSVTTTMVQQQVGSN